MKPPLRAERLSAYFIVAALIHVVAVASRFDTLAKQLPEVVAPALMLVQFPLLVLSGYFESRLDYGSDALKLPLWMRIKSRPVKLAMTFGFIYIVLIPLQTWDVSIGPLDPTPPAAFPEAQRAMWFAMFTAGMFFPFYMAATGLLIPVTRVLTWPLRELPAPLAAILALVVGSAIGLFVFALSTRADLAAFVAAIKGYFKANPWLGIAITLATTFGPLIIGLVRGKQDE